MLNNKQFTVGYEFFGVHTFILLYIYRNGQKYSHTR